MFSRVPERVMLSTRALLTFAWIVLIASLIWNPLASQSGENADRANLLNAAGETVFVQDSPVPVGDYQALGVPIFWAMVVPILPLFLMVFGHEAWRRVCPISFVSQIPRMTGWQRGRKHVNRKTGRIEKHPNLLDRKHWLQEFNCLVQLGFLYTGLVFRLLFANSDPTALFIMLSVVILGALGVGYCFGGKTWCNYFCPIATIQRIYSGPGGLLESKARIHKSALSKSMCRVPSKDGDRTSCIGCTTNCPDIDLENAYWKSILNPARQFTYYSFFGLVLGFYSYFYVYAGNWDYYFSGAWTRDPTLFRQILTPGLFLFDADFRLPKCAAAPLFLAVCGLASYLLFLGVEQTYRWARTRLECPLADDVLRHQMFTIVAFLSINAFYVFGGRPTILLFPDWTVRLVDAGILFLTSAWVWQTWRRSAALYRRESMVGGLREQLRTLEVPADAFLASRKLEDLSADEVYLLATALPGVLQQQKTAIYERIINDRLDKRMLFRDESKDALSDLRDLLSVSDEHHHQTLSQAEARTQMAANNAPPCSNLDSIRPQEDQGQLKSGVEACPSAQTRLKQSKLKRMLERLLAFLFVSGVTRDPVSTKTHNKAYQKTAEAEGCLDDVKQLAVVQFRLSQRAGSEFELMNREIAVRQDMVLRAFVQALNEVENVDAALRLARAAFALERDGDRELEDRISEVRPHLLTALSFPSVHASRDLHQDVFREAPPLGDVLGNLTDDGDPVMQSLALVGMCRIDFELARAKAGRVRLSSAQCHWLPALIIDVLERDDAGPADLSIVRELIDRMRIFSMNSSFSSLTLVELCEFAVDVGNVHFPFGERYAELRPAPTPYVPSLRVRQ